MSVLMLFFDGLGLGSDDPAENPLLTASMPTWLGLLGSPPSASHTPLHSSRATLVPTDANLDTPGLPQSATGQTAILTGVNAAREIGEHWGPYPNAALRRILSNGNLFHRLITAHRRVAFANAYPPIFFERLARNKARRSAISFAADAAGVQYRTVDDLRAGRAVSVFVTNARWPRTPSPTGSSGAAEAAKEPIPLGDVPIITARAAGRNLARIAAEHDFTLFEYFLTDAAGHKRDSTFAHLILNEIDQLLEGVLDETDLGESLVMTTSDHGNIEDLTARKHTRNPVPTLLIGAGHAEIAPLIHSLEDITPAVLHLLA